MIDASADETAPDCDCEMLALRASVLMLPLMREKKDSRSRDDPDARVDGASLFDAPESAVPRRSRFAISDMRSSESRSVSSSSDDETSSNIATRSFGEIIGSAAFSPTEIARAASTWRTSFGPWVASHSPTDSWSGRSRSAESTGDAAMCWRTSVTRISPSAGPKDGGILVAVHGRNLHAGHELTGSAGVPALACKFGEAVVAATWVNATRSLLCTFGMPAHRLWPWVPPRRVSDTPRQYRGRLGCSRRRACWRTGWQRGMRSYARSMRL